MIDGTLPPASSRLVGTADGIQIAYDLYPGGDLENLALVVPGFWRDRKYPAIMDFCERLRQNGFTTAVLDLRGHGGSGGTYGFNLDEHLDVQAVASELLREDPRIRHILLIGLSLGAAIAVSTAARHRELPIAGLLLISPVARFRRIRPVIHPLSMHRHLSVSQALKKPRFRWDFWRSPKLHADEDVRKVHIPLTLIHVKNDWLVHHGHSLALYAAANEPKTLHLIDVKGNFHADRILSACAEEFDPLLAQFLEGWLVRQRG